MRSILGIIMCGMVVYFWGVAMSMTARDEEKSGGKKFLYVLGYTLAYAFLFVFFAIVGFA